VCKADVLTSINFLETQGLSSPVQGLLYLYSKGHITNREKTVNQTAVVEYFPGSGVNTDEINTVTCVPEEF